MIVKFVLGACCAGVVAVSSAMDTSELWAELERVADANRQEKHMEVSEIFDRHLGPLSTPAEIESYFTSGDFDVTHVTSGVVIERTCADADRLLVAKRLLEGGIFSLSWREVQAIVCFRDDRKLAVFAYLTYLSL